MSRQLNRNVFSCLLKVSYVTSLDRSATLNTGILSIVGNFSMQVRLLALRSPNLALVYAFISKHKNPAIGKKSRSDRPL